MFGVETAPKFSWLNTERGHLNSVALVASDKPELSYAGLTCGVWESWGEVSEHFGQKGAEVLPP